MTVVEPAPVIVGRSTELATIGAWLDADTTPRGVLVVSGPAGIGKSALLRAALTRAGDTGWTVLAATAVEDETGLAHVTLADLLQDVPPDELEVVEPAHREVLHAVRSLTDLQVSDRTVAAALAHLLDGTTRPVLVVVDDEQWLDEQSASAIRYAARRTPPETVRFLFSRREDEPGPVEPTLRDRTTTLRLGPLTASDTRALLRDRVGRMSRETLGTVVDAAAGNPLFALELAALLTRPGAHLRVPRTIIGLLAERLDRLTAGTRRALLAVALSPGARTAEIVAVAGLDAVDEARAAYVLEQRGDMLSPTHPLLGTAAVETSTPDERRALHGLLADVVTDDLRHWLHAARAVATPDDALATEVAAASARATARGRRRTATELAEHALRLTPAGSAARDARLLSLATCCTHSGDAERALDLLAAVPDLATPELRARGWLLRVDLDPVPLGELERYLDLAAAEIGDDPGLRALVLMERCAFAARGSLSRLEAAEGWADAALALSGADVAIRRRALFELAWVRADRCRPIDDLLAEELALPGEPTVIVYSVERVALISRMWRGDLDAARAAFESMLTEAEERGESESVTVLLIQLAEADLRAARWADAERRLDQLGVERRFQDIDPGILRLRALVAAGRGDPAAAREQAEQAIELSRASELRWQELEAWRAVGQAALLAGEPETARDALLPRWEHLVAGGFTEPGAFPFAVDLAEALVASGSEGTATARGIAEALRLLPDHPWAAAAAVAVDGHVAAGERDDERAVSAYTTAAAAFGRLGFRLDEARLLGQAGLAARRRRRLREARELLDGAVALFEEIGSDGWAERARAERARVGGRPASGIGLTETERRVALLVAEGRRNRDVAKALFVTESAVEATLSRVYAKLGIRSRTELAARLRRRT